jgi:hypothetical protein
VSTGISRKASTVATKALASAALSAGTVLQRKCACGQHTGGGECTDCAKKHAEAKQGSGAIKRLAATYDNTAPPPFERDIPRDFTRVAVHSLPARPAAAPTGVEVKLLAHRGGNGLPGTSSPSILQLGGGSGEQTRDGGAPDAGGAPDGGGPVDAGAQPGAGGPAAAAGGAGAPPAPAVPAAPPAAAAMPTAALARFVTTGPVQCCRVAGDHGCPPHLGPSTAADGRDQNGMNLVFTISGDRPGIQYGFVQVEHDSLCSRNSAAAGGAWNQTITGPGAADGPIPAATCLTPNAANEITMTDAPGFATALGGAPPAGLDEMSMRMNASDWVIARQGRGRWQRISDLFVWHSISRIRRNGAGNWELFPNGNSLGQGATALGGCPPP